MSHLTKGMALFSCCASSLVGQALRRRMGDAFLFTVTLSFEVLALAVAFFLPQSKATPTSNEEDTEDDDGFTAKQQRLGRHEDDDFGKVGSGEGERRALLARSAAPAPVAKGEEKRGSKENVTLMT